MDKKSANSKIYSICECGQELNYKLSIVMGLEQRVCPNCGKVHYVETPIDWARVFLG